MANRYFNPVQSECFDVACASDLNMVRLLLLLLLLLHNTKSGQQALKTSRVVGQHMCHPGSRLGQNPSCLL